MKKYGFIIIIFFLGCTQTKKPNIEDLFFDVIYNESVNTDLIFIAPKEDSKFLIKDVKINSCSDTIFIEIYELTTSKIGARETLSIKRDSNINYISIQNVVFDIEAIRRSN